MVRWEETVHDPLLNEPLGVALELRLGEQVGHERLLGRLSGVRRLLRRCSQVVRTRLQTMCM